MQRLAKSMPLVEHRRLAESTREKLETFKTYVPVINAICNPGEEQSRRVRDYPRKVVLSWTDG
jgi:hypothetical protein